MRFKKLPIRIKIVVPMVAALIVMLAWAYIYFPNHYKRALSRAYSRDAFKTASFLATAVSSAVSHHNYELLQKSLQSAQADSNILFIVVYDETQKVLASYYSPRVSMTDSCALLESSHFEDNSLILVKRDICAIADQKIGQLYLGYDLTQLNRAITEVRSWTFLVTLLSLALGLLLLRQVSLQITRSTVQLRQQMLRVIESRRYVGRILVSSRDEIGDLGNLFNKMMAEIRSRHHRLLELQSKTRALYTKLHRLSRLRSIFISDAAHYLRTPLTVITGEVEIALFRKRNAKEYQNVLQIVKEECAHLDRIVENLLTLAKADTGKLVTVTDIINCSAICEKQIKKIKSIAESKNLRLQTRIEEDCFIRGDPNRISELIYNLLENAVKYTPENKSVSVRLKTRGNHLYLRVSDTGIGLHKEDIEKIFNRFYRGKNAKKMSKGTGLGLAICESIVKAHGGQIYVSSEPGEGSTFEVKLKCNVDGETSYLPRGDAQSHPRSSR